MAHAHHGNARPLAITRYLQRRLNEWLAANPGTLKKDLADRIGISGAHVTNITKDDRETIANGVAGALAMPQGIFGRMFRANGFDLSWMAAEFIVPEGAVALRVGEVTGEPVALVTPKRIHRRDEHNQLPANDDLRRLSRQTLDPWHPVTAVRCRDVANTYAFRLSA